jgi:hypothetical protein
VDQLSFVSSVAFTLNNVTIPVISDGTTKDIACWIIRPDNQSIETPQYCRDVSLNKLKRAIGQPFMNEEPVEIHAPNSAGEYHLIQTDHHLQMSITLWMGLYARNSAPPEDYFRIHFMTETTQ